MLNNAFELHHPEIRDTSVIFASPHSGRDYDGTFRGNSILDGHQIRTSEDAFVDLLYAQVPQCGAPFLTATAPRAFVDLNRSATELDAALIKGAKRHPGNPRIACGLGVIPRVVAHALPIYLGKIPMQEAQARIATYWHPYHDALRGLMDENHARFGQAILIDCHSMPHEALNTGDTHGPTPDVVIGDRFGASASAQIVEQVEAAFTDAGFRVARNTPFAGAFITQHYGRPSRGYHAIQVELDRSLYMNEQTITPHHGFDEIQGRLTQVSAQIAGIGRENPVALAAE